MKRPPKPPVTGRCRKCKINKATSRIEGTKDGKPFVYILCPACVWEGLLWVAEETSRRDGERRIPTKDHSTKGRRDP